MNSLIKDLQTPKKTLEEFFEVTKRVLSYLTNVISGKNEVKGYILMFSEVAGTRKLVRPIQNNLFIFDAETFETETNRFISILNKSNNNHENLPEDSYRTIDSVTYTIQQSIGVGLDLLSNPNSARKHVGNRFEELIRIILVNASVSNKKIVFKIPYPTDDGDKVYSCETDLIISPLKEVQSGTTKIDINEVVVSLKTSSKDRMGKIFLDKMLMEKFANHPVKVIGIFLNDVQRKEEKSISYTFVSGLFMVYTKFLCVLEGVYFVDPPPKVKESPFNKHIFPFSQFILDDIPKLTGVV